MKSNKMQKLINVLYSTYCCHRWLIHLHNDHSHVRPSHGVDIHLKTTRCQCSTSCRARFLLNRVRRSYAETVQISCKTRWKNCTPSPITTIENSWPGVLKFVKIRLIDERVEWVNQWSQFWTFDFASLQLVFELWNRHFRTVGHTCTLYMF